MSEENPLLLRFDAFELDERQMRLTRHGQPLAVPPKAFAVLCALAGQPGQLVRKSELLDQVWGHRYVSESVLKTTISELRAALGDNARAPRCIETASRHGYRFIASVSHGMATPAPPTAAPAWGPAQALVGRAAAATRLREAWQRAQAGQRQIVWLSGEAGIGKSTLIDHFAAASGVRAAYGHCVEQYGAGEAHLPVLEALSSLCSAAPELPQLLRQVAPTWLLQLPWLTSEQERVSLREQLGGSGPERMPREFAELLERWSADHPLLLVTEDLHWSDTATLRLIDHVARRRGPARLLWLASFRVAEVVAEDHPLRWLRQELRLHRMAEEIGLDAFSEQEVADYVAARAPGRALSEDQARALHRRTDGLPLFVAHVVDDWLERDAPLGDTPHPVFGDGEAVLPETLAGVVERQVQRLAPEQQELLEAAAVCGQEFRVSTLAEVLEREPAGVGASCDDLARGSQWLALPEVNLDALGAIDACHAFRHGFYRQVLNRRIGALRRLTLHRQVAAALTRLRQGGVVVPASELALHHEAGQQWALALQHHAEAALNALERFAPAEAMHLVQHALTLLPRCPEGMDRDRMELMLLGRHMTASQLLSPSAPEARASYPRVRELHAKLPDDSSGFDIEIGWLHCTAAEYAQAFEIAEAIHAAADPAGNLVRYVAACNLLGTTLLSMGRLGAARLRLEEGLRAAAELGDRPSNALSVIDLQVSLHCRLSQALSSMGCVDTALAHAQAAQERAANFGPYTRRVSLLFLGQLHAALGNPQQVQDVADQLARLAEAFSMPEAAAPAAWLRGWALAQRGDPGAGHALIVSGAQSDERLGFRRGRSGVLGFAAEALALAGRPDEAQRQITEALAFAQTSGERLHLPQLLLLRARVALQQGAAGMAEEALNACMQEARSQEAHWTGLRAQLFRWDIARPGVDRIKTLAAARALVPEGSLSEPVSRADALLMGARAPRLDARR